MNLTELRLQYLDAEGQAVDLPLAGNGVSIASTDEGGPQTVDDKDAQLKLVGDDLACWLHVYGERNSVHLNGRPVTRLAHVRAGDRVYLDGHPFHLVGDVQRTEPDAEPTDTASSAQFCLRGLSGEQYGMAIPVETELRVGTGSRADVRLDDVNLPAEFATLTATETGLRFSVADAVPSQVNGLNIRSGILEVGDQWTLAGKYRFAVESPDFLDIVRPDVSAAERAALLLSEEQRRRLAERRKLLTRLAWLVGVCVLISLIVTALIVYAPQ